MVLWCFRSLRFRGCIPCLSLGSLLPVLLFLLLLFVMRLTGCGFALSISTMLLGSVVPMPRQVLLTFSSCLDPQVTSCLLVGIMSRAVALELSALNGQVTVSMVTQSTETTSSSRRWRRLWTTLPKTRLTPRSCSLCPTGLKLPGGTSPDTSRSCTGTTLVLSSTLHLAEAPIVPLTYRMQAMRGVWIVSLSVGHHGLCVCSIRTHPQSPRSTQMYCFT